MMSQPKKRQKISKSNAEKREDTEAVTEYMELASTYNNDDNDNNSTKDLCVEQKLFYVLNDKVLVIMKPTSTFHFIGKLKVHVLYGSIEIFGYIYNVSSELLEVYSPRSSSFIPINSTTSTSEDDTLYDLTKVKDYLSKEGVDFNIKSSLVNHFEECTNGWAIILLQNFENILTTFLNNFCQHQLFPAIENNYIPDYNSIEKAEFVLQAFLRTRGKGGHVIEMPLKWDTVALNFAKKDLMCESRSRLIIFGGKGVGKSTAIRYLINKTLQSVQNKKIILMDLDPGQAECTPSGSISLVIIDKPLLGPNFTHTMIPYYEIALGKCDVAQCVTRYMKSIAKLIDILNTDEGLKGLSVIVNTMGFCVSIGKEIACSIIKLLQPTDVIQIISKQFSNNFSCHLTQMYVKKQNSNFISRHLPEYSINKKCNYDFQIIPSNSEKISDKKKLNLWPYQKREISLMSYLSKIIEGKLLYDETLPNINSIKPYSVSFSSIYISLINTSALTNLVLSVINGNIVALSTVDIEENENDIDSGIEGIKVFNNPPIAKCHGHGIVRGIDMENKLIFINTPLKLDTLRSVNCLEGFINTPKEILDLDKNDKPYTTGSNDHKLPTSKDTRRDFFNRKRSKK